MKKLVLTTVCALAMSGAAFAQGYISYSLSFSYVTAQTNSTQYSPLFGGGTVTGPLASVGATGGAVGTGLIYDYALLYMPNTVTPGVGTSTVWDGTWSGAVALTTPYILTGTNNNTAGRISTVQPAANTQVNWAAGTTDNIVLVGWSANLGTTWVGVSNILAQLALGNTAPLFAADTSGSQAFFGVSTLGYINPTASTPGAAIVGNQGGIPGANGLAIYSLNTPLYLLPVPEPASMALAGLGGLSLLLFRRQRK
jgi:hypothetical protein